MLLLRKLLFLGFSIVYIIVCPILILYSLGYIYNPVAGELIQTGVLHIASIPTGAGVYLGKSRFTYRTPATISKLLIGSYKVTLRKRGYRPWTQWITIEGGKAVTLKNILLIPYNWPEKDVTTHICQDLISIENKHSFLVTTGSELGSFFIYGADGGIRPLLSYLSPFSTVSVIDIHPVANNGAIIMYAGSFWNRKNIYLNLEGDEPNAIDLTKLFGGEDVSVIWQEEDNLFYRQKKCINYVKVKTGETYPCYLEGVKGFGTYGEWMYVMDENDILTRRLFGGRKEENLSRDTFAANRLFRRSEFYNIEARNEAVVFFLGTEGDFIVNLPPYYIATEAVLGYRFSGNKNLLLYWTKTSLAVVDFSADEDGTIFYESFRVQTAYKDGKNIKQGFWADDNSHILCNDDSSVYLIELLPQGSAHVEPVVRIKDRTGIFYDSDKRALYYLDKQTGVLKRLEIISKQMVTMIPPETRD